MNTGDKLRFRNINEWFMAGPASLKVTDSNAKLYGKLVKSLTLSLAVSTDDNKFANMFYGSTALIDASEFDLYDGITLTEKCYSGMFSNCKSLISAPALPATTLASDCYNTMFSNCTSLVNAPDLPATILASGCYSSMFNGCDSLSFAPELPAVVLANNCYDSMFMRCTSLVNAPKLPATTLANNCYYYMFYNCTEITELHYPTSLSGNSTFTNMGGPKFGATIDDSKIFYDL